MKLKLKPRTYYKRYYNNYSDDAYYILYTGNKWVYILATKHKHVPLIKHTKKQEWDTIKKWQYDIDNRKYNVKMEEVSKEDVFLELL